MFRTKSEVSHIYAHRYLQMYLGSGVCVDDRQWCVSMYYQLCKGLGFSEGEVSSDVGGEWV